MEITMRKQISSIVTTVILLVNLALACYPPDLPVHNVAMLAIGLPCLGMIAYAAGRESGAYLVLWGTFAGLLAMFNAIAFPMYSSQDSHAAYFFPYLLLVLSIFLVWSVTTERKLTLVTR
jgi:hypothetical protein